MNNIQNLTTASANPAAKTFMLVHGAWHGAWVWDAVADHLRAQGHIVYTPTLSGLGERATELSAAISLDTFIEDIVDAILHPQSAPALAPQRLNSPARAPGPISAVNSHENRNQAAGLGHAATSATSDPSRSSSVPPGEAAKSDPADSLTKVILVGHSFAGVVISAVADRIGPHLDRLIYLDAFLLPPGQSTFDTLPDKVVQALTAAAQAHGGYGLPAPDPIHLGIPANNEHYANVRSHLTPHPINTYASKLTLQNSPGAGLKTIYLACTDPAYKPVAAAHDWVRAQQDWILEQLASSHSAPVLVPDQVAEKLIMLASV